MYACSASRSGCPDMGSDPGESWSSPTLGTSRGDRSSYRASRTFALAMAGRRGQVGRAAPPAGSDPRVLADLPQPVAQGDAQTSGDGGIEMGDQALPGPAHLL